MNPIAAINSTAVPLLRDAINTDDIISATYMRRLTRDGYDDVLFDKWRADPDFVLNDAAYHGAQILISGTEFGSGSSREHAPWALRDGGFRAVLAVSFADIFRGNCGKVGFVAAALPRADIERLAARCTEHPTTELSIDLSTRSITCPAIGFYAPLELDEHTRRRLLSGRDDIDETLRHLDTINAFEATRPRWLPTTSRPDHPAQPATEPTTVPDPDPEKTRSAKSFDQLAEDWIAAINAHDLERVMHLYSPQIIFRSAGVTRQWDRPDGLLSGRGELREHFRRSLALAPNLHFTLTSVLAAPTGYAIAYTRENGHNGLMAVDVDHTGRATRATAFSPTDQA